MSQPPPDSLISYTLSRNPGDASDAFTITNGEKTYHANKVSHKFSADEWVISTFPKSDFTASAKLKASTRECKIKIGKKGDWETIRAIDELATAYALGASGRVWERLHHDPSSGDITELQHGHMNLRSADGSLVAIYYRGNQGGTRIGQLDFFTKDLSEEEQMYALVAVLGLTECRALDEKSRNMPLQEGVVPNFVPGPSGWK